MSFDLSARLAVRRAENLYRQRPLLQSPQGPQVVVDGQPLLIFLDEPTTGLDPRTRARMALSRAENLYRERPG